MRNRVVSSAALVLLIAGMHGCDKHNKPAPVDKPADSPAATNPESTPTPPAPVRNHAYAKPADYEAPALNTTELPSGLKIEDLKIGDGAICLPKAIATFHYRAKPKDGEEFVATAEQPDPAEPESQPLTKMLPGMKEGLVGMRVGGRRRLTIPADLAFSSMGAKSPEGKEVVPPDTTVIFIIDLLELKQGITAPAAPGTAK